MWTAHFVSANKVSHLSTMGLGELIYSRITTPPHHSCQLFPRRSGHLYHIEPKQFQVAIK